MHIVRERVEHAAQNIRLTGKGHGVVYRMTDRSFQAAQRAYDNQEPPELEDDDEDDFDFDESQGCACTECEGSGQGGGYAGECPHCDGGWV